MNIDYLKRKFIDLYGPGEIEYFFSPSRINIIGEHIDYNGGKVLPGAIEMGTYGLVRKRKDNLLRLASGNIAGKLEVDLEDLSYEKAHGWGNYPKGVAYFMKKKGYKLGGMDIYVEGNIPNGAGLSSSASLELLIAQMINSLFNQGEISMIELALIGQRAENDFVGVNCGIMDQFAIAMGKKNKAILLDTDTLEYDYIEMDLKDNIIVIMNTNKRRELSDSKYNERRAECEKALEILKEYRDIDNLCDLAIEEFDEIKYHIGVDNIRNRAEHAVYENHRVNLASRALKEGKMDLLGRLLQESHSSLKELYEVTGIELDSLVEAANQSPYCLGARMTGAGFGGCAIALVKTSHVEDFIKDIGQVYLEKVSYAADFYITGIGDGTRKL